jgi:hypothetical protein
MMLTSTILDSASEVLAYYAAEYPAFIRKAMKSAGWMLQKQIKAGILSGAPGGSQYPAILPQPFRARLDELQGSAVKTDTKIMGKLAQAVGYQYADGVLRVGWLSATAVRYGEMEEEGAVKPFDTQARQRFLAAGLTPRSAKAEIVIPKRPTYTPMFAVLRGQIAPYIEERMDEYLTKGVPAPVKNPRKYVVKG